MGTYRYCVRYLLLMCQTVWKNRSLSRNGTTPFRKPFSKLFQDTYQAGFSLEMNKWETYFMTWVAQRSALPQPPGLKRKGFLHGWLAVLVFVFRADRRPSMLCRESNALNQHIPFFLLSYPRSTTGLMFVMWISGHDRPTREDLFNSTHAPFPWGGNDDILLRGQKKVAERC